MFAVLIGSASFKGKTDAFFQSIILLIYNELAKSG